MVPLVRKSLTLLLSPLCGRTIRSMIGNIGAPLLFTQLDQLPL
jgi:hypothetical protein